MVCGFTLGHVSHVNIVLCTAHTAHSGGGNEDNIKLMRFGPSFRWMLYEALEKGLRLEPYQGGWSPPTHRPSMTPIWLIMELYPWKRLAYIGRDQTERWLVI